VFIAIEAAKDQDRCSAGQNQKFVGESGDKSASKNDTGRWSDNGRSTGKLFLEWFQQLRST
jgi:hypothetical protein